MTMDKMKDQVRPEAVSRIESSLVLEQIAKDENIEVSDADVDAEIDKMASMYGMEADKIKEMFGDSENKQISEDIAVQKAVDFLVKESVEVEPKEEEKEEKAE